MADDTDSLLANFSRELDYFVLARNRPQPVMEQLLGALERLVANAADGVALIERSTFASPISNTWPASAAAGACEHCHRIVGQSAETARSAFARNGITVGIGS